MKTAKQNFLEFYSNYYGEEVDNLSQIQGDILDGQEQFDFVSAFANQNKWISVFKKLPEKYGTYLVLSNKGIEEGTYFNASFGDRFRMREALHTQVTHWMPLPESPIK